MAITVAIAWGGFRSFNRWRREQLEAKRIDIAFDALTLAHETKSVFQHIRGPLVLPSEWADMPAQPNDTEQLRLRRGEIYATTKRINDKREFFERVARIQPRCMAAFGPEVAKVFKKLHIARAHLETAVLMLTHEIDNPCAGNDQKTKEHYEEMRRDLWDLEFPPEEDRVGQMLREFTDGVIAFTKPPVVTLYGIKSRQSAPLTVMTATSRRLNTMGAVLKKTFRKNSERFR